MTDALERLKNRTRPTVRSRDTSLSSTTPDISTSRLQESETPGSYGNFESTSQDISTSRLPEFQQSIKPDYSNPSNKEISTSRHTDPQKPINNNTSISTNPDTSISASPDISTSRNLDTQNSRLPDIDESNFLDIQKPINRDSATALLPDATISSHPGTEPALKTKQSTLRLEQGVGDRLQDLCRDQGICREVLIEALFEFGEAHPDLLAIVLTNAKVKHSQRQQLANQRRAQSMMQRFGQP